MCAFRSAYSDIKHRKGLSIVKGELVTIVESIIHSSADATGWLHVVKGLFCHQGDHVGLCALIAFSLHLFVSLGVVV